MLNDVRVVVRKNWYVIISAKYKIFHNDFNKYTNKMWMDIELLSAQLKIHVHIYFNAWLIKQ